MGAVDLVVQVESPKSVTRGLQRIGRAGHGVGEVSRGRIFPKFRADLLECAVVARRMREGLIETTVVPRNPLDVLAQQVVAIAASAGEEGVAVDELHALVRRTWTYADLERRQLENVLDMLDGRYPSQEFGELRPRIVWDRVAGTIRARAGRAVAGRGQRRHHPGPRPVQRQPARRPPRRRARRGDGLRGARRPDVPAGRHLLAHRADHARPRGRHAGARRARRGALLARRGRRAARASSARPSARSRARPCARTRPPCERDYDLDERAASNLLAFLREQEAATGVRAVGPHAGRGALPRRDRRLAAVRALALRRPRARGVGAGALGAHPRRASASRPTRSGRTTASSSTCPTPTTRPGAELVLVEPDEAEDLVVAELGASALFGARFRENAARSLLIPRAYPGRRTPLWQQRLKAQSLLEVARRYPQFPVILETYRECLRDVLDVPGLQDAAAQACTRASSSLVEVETQTASPFASSLLFDYVATYMYEGDTPAAERRAVALCAGPRAAARAARAGGAARPHRPRRARAGGGRPAAPLRAPAGARRRRAARRAAARRRPDGGRRRRSAREPPAQAGAWLARLEDERRALRARLGGEERWLAAEDAGLYRDALGVVPPGGLPDAFLERRARRDAAAAAPLRAHARARSRPGEVRARYGVDAGPALAELERAGELVRGELRPLGTQREWCDPDVLRRLRRASLAVLRKEIEPVGQATLARFAPAWQGVDRYAPAGAGVDRLRDVLAPLQGLPLAPELWEKDVLPRRLGTYSPYWLDELCASGEVVWVGAGPLGGRSGRVALYFRDDAPLLGPPPGARRARRAASSTSCCASGWRAAPASSPTCWWSTPASRAEELREALWDLAWAGEATNDAFAPLRAAARARRRPAAPPARRAGAPVRRAASAAAPAARRRCRAAGRWPTPCSAPRRPTPEARAPGLGRAAARAPRRAHARAGARRGLPRRLLGALPGAVGARDARRRPPRLLRRGPRRRPVRAAGRRRAAARRRRRRRTARWSSPPPTRRSSTAPACAGRTPEVRPPSRRAGRVPGAPSAGRPALSVHAGGRSLRIARPAGGRRRRRSGALAAAVRDGPPAPARRRAASTASRPSPARWPSGSWRSASAAASTTSRLAPGDA